MPNSAAAGVTTWAGDTPNANYVAFRFSSTTDTTWKLVAATDNTHQTVVDTGVAIDTSSHLFEIFGDGAGTFYAYIDGAYKCSVATNVPASLVQGFATVDNKNTANARTLSWAYMYGLIHGL
jgi:hypothetical protein